MIYIIYKDSVIKNEQINNHIAFDCMQQYSSASIRFTMTNLINKFITQLHVAPELNETSIKLNKTEIQKSFELAFNTTIDYFSIFDSLNINIPNAIDENKTEIDYIIANIKYKLSTSPKFIQFIINNIHEHNANVNVVLVISSDDSIRIISNIYTLNDINDKFRLVRVSKVENINVIQKNNVGFKISIDPFFKYYDYILAISTKISIATIKSESRYIKRNKVK